MIQDIVNEVADPLHSEIERLTRELAEAQSDRQREHDLRCRLAGELETTQELLAEAQRDAQRLDWIGRHLIEGKWDGTIGRPKSWVMRGPYRHKLQAMSGNTLREAIDAAMKEGER